MIAFLALGIRKSILVALFNILAFTKFDFLDLVNFDFLDLAKFIIVDRFSIFSPILILLIPVNIF